LWLDGWHRVQTDATGLGGEKVDGEELLFPRRRELLNWSIELEEKVWTSLERERKLEQGKGRKLIQDCFSGSPA
jgi:hypothetical protein